MYKQQNVEESDFEQSICVCVSVRLAVAFLASSHGRKGKPIELKLKSMFGHMGHCVVSIFVAIRQPVYNIQKKVFLKEEENAQSKFLSQLPLKLRVSSQYKSRSIASYDKTKIPLNLRRKTVSQIISKEE